MRNPNSIDDEDLINSEEYKEIFNELESQDIFTEDQLSKEALRILRKRLEKDYFNWQQDQADYEKDFDYDDLGELNFL